MATPVVARLDARMLQAQTRFDWLSICLSAEELTEWLNSQGRPLTMSAARVLRFTHRFRSGALCEVEIDLEAVRDNSFTPHFRWHGTTHKAHELISWVRDVFGRSPIARVFRSCGALCIGGTAQPRLGSSSRAKSRDG